MCSAECVLCTVYTRLVVHVNTMYVIHVIHTWYTQNNSPKLHVGEICNIIWLGYFLYYMTSPAIIMSTCKVTSPAIMLYSLVVRWHTV